MRRSDSSRSLSSCVGPQGASLQQHHVEGLAKRLLNIHHIWVYTGSKLQADLRPEADIVQIFLQTALQINAENKNCYTTVDVTHQWTKYVFLFFLLV